MPALQGKKEVVVGSKVSQEIADALISICIDQDRSMSYVVRELVLRGMANFFNDGSVKPDELEMKALDAGMRQLRSKSGEPALEDVKARTRTVQPEAEITDGKARKKRKAR